MTPETKASLSAFGVLAFGGIAYGLTGSIYSSAEAQVLVTALSSSGLYLGSAMVGGSGTILALMLTLVGLVKRVDEDFDAPIYKRIARVSFLSTLSLIGSVALLLVLTMPVGEFDKLPPQWYPTLYRVLLAFMVGISALMVGTVVLLYQTVVTLIANITPTEDV
ncbi:MAG: hypothetical protein QUV08_04660 [Parasphingorhabdus sp.]|nr:hypothetical protein [Parasphingorhabdus sp.]